MAKLCPSAQPGMEQCRVLGVVQRDGPTPILQYLNEHLPATDEVLALHELSDLVFPGKISTLRHPDVYVVDARPPATKWPGALRIPARTPGARRRRERPS